MQPNWIRIIKTFNPTSYREKRRQLLTLRAGCRIILGFVFLCHGSVLFAQNDEKTPKQQTGVSLGKAAEETTEGSELKPTQNPTVALNINLKDVVREGGLTEPGTTKKSLGNYRQATLPEEKLGPPVPKPIRPEQIDDAALRALNEPPSNTEALQQPETALIDELEKFVILETEVMPGTSSRLSWVPRTSIRGLSVPTPVLVHHGSMPGPTLCLTGAIHGDELNGIEIIRRVMYDIDPSKLYGKLIGVPIVNLQGFQRNSRYLPDRRDLNRFFPGDSSASMASRIAHSLFTEIISHCDHLVDLHTGSMLRTNLPQLRADMSNPKVAEFANHFDELVIVHSVGSPGMLRSAANNNGITTVTLETGESTRIQEDQIVAGARSINGLLDRLGMYPRLLVWGKAQPAYYESKWVRVQSGGILFSEAELGDNVEIGDDLGKVTDPITNKVTTISSPVAGRVIGMAVNQVVMPGFAAYHIGTRTTPDKMIEQAEERLSDADMMG